MKLYYMILLLVNIFLIYSCGVDSVEIYENEESVMFYNRKDDKYRNINNNFSVITFKNISKDKYILWLDVITKNECEVFVRKIEIIGDDGIYGSQINSKVMLAEKISDSYIYEIKLIQDLNAEFLNKKTVMNGTFSVVIFMNINGIDNSVKFIVKRKKRYSPIFQT